MDGEHSADLFRRLSRGDESAARQVFDRFADRLAALAFSRLSQQMKRRIDAEDVVQSVYRSFFRRAEDGQFVIDEAGDLWRLLAAITISKVRGQVEFHTAKKRTIRQEDSLDSDQSVFVAPEVISRDPSPDDAALMIEELRIALSQFEPTQRLIIELSLQGLSEPDVAKQVSRSQRTVRRTLTQLRGDLENRLRERSTE